MKRFKDNDDGTVTDNQTGLMWLKNAGLVSQRDWDRAINFCEGLKIAGYNDWRLPTVKELFSLVDPSQYRPALPEGHPFTNVQSSGYWSSSTYAFSTSSAWRVGMSYGYVYSNSKSSYHYVWPVRGGSL